MYNEIATAQAGFRGAEDEIWIRDQTARILHRYILSGKHCRLDLGALLSRLVWIQGDIPAPDNAVPELKAA